MAQKIGSLTFDEEEWEKQLKQINNNRNKENLELEKRVNKATAGKGDFVETRGYRFGDLTNEFLKIGGGFVSTGLDLGLDILEGGLGYAEGGIDTLAYFGADVLDTFGAGDLASDLRNRADFNSTAQIFGKNPNVQQNFGNWTQGIEEASWSPDYIDQIAQGIGQIGTAGLTAAATGGGSLASAGVTFASSYGNARSEAKRNGASDADAHRAGLIGGFAETISEQFFSGIPGMKVEGWGDKLTGKIADKVTKYFGTKTGKIALKAMDSLGEGSEEIISNILNAALTDIGHAINNEYTYGMENMSGNILEDTWNQLWSSDSWGQFLSAALSSAIVNGGKAVFDTKTQNKIINAYAQDNNMSFQDAKYILTGQMENAQQELIRDKAEYNSQIELRDMAKNRVLNYMENYQGQNIESQIEQQIKQEEQDLGQEFTEEQREQMKKDIRAELEDRINSKNRYTEFTQETDNERDAALVKSFQENNRNNTKESHEIYNLMKTLQDNNPTANYRVTSNEELAKMGELERVEQDGKVKYLKNGQEVSINGFKKGDTIYINADGINPYQATIGHEIAEAIKASDPQAYEQLKSLVKQVYGEGNLDDYKAIYGENLTDNVEDEYINDKLGEMFKDNKLINRVADNRNLLQKFIDEVKRLIKYVTSNSEKKQLQKLQKTLEDKYVELYKEADFNKGSENTSFSLDENLEKSKEEVSLSYAKQRFNRNIGKYSIGDNLEDAYLEHQLRKDELDSLYEYAKKKAYNDSELRELERRYNELLERDEPNQANEIRYSLTKASEEQRQQATKLEEQGKSVEDIYLETGIYRGADGLWRSEIDDSGAKILLSVPYTPNNKTYKLSELLDHPKLYEAYPDFKDINVTIEEMAGDYLGGVDEYGDLHIDSSRYDAHQRSIDKLEQTYKNLNSPDGRLLFGDELEKELEKLQKEIRDFDYKTYQEDLKSVLLHEIQHKIQDREGFAQGTNTTTTKEKHDKYIENLFELRSELSGLYEKSGIGEKWVEENMPRVLSNEITMDEFFEEQKQARLKSSVGSLIREKLDELEDYEYRYGVYGRMPYDLYENTAGEIEAREVEKRMNMSPEERKANLPFTKDEKTIFAEPTLNRKYGVVKDSNVRYSLSTDSQGRELSQQQQEYFKDSKIRDTEGKLIPLYHGSNSEFTIFDISKSGESSKEAKVGFWFTPNKKGAENFANEAWYGDKKPTTYEVYLNIKNPKIYETYEVNQEQRDNMLQNMRNLEQEIKNSSHKYSWTETEDYKVTSLYNDLVQMYRKEISGIEDSQYNEDFYRKLAQERNISNEKFNEMSQDAKNQIALEQQNKKARDDYYSYVYSDGYEQFKTDLYLSAGMSAEDANIGGMGMMIKNENEAVANFVEKLKQDGYDGIIIKDTHYDTESLGEGKNNDQYVAFYSNQIKNIDNLKPTENNDIRYSLTEANYTNEELETIKKQIPKFAGMTKEQLGKEYGYASDSYAEMTKLANDLQKEYKEFQKTPEFMDALQNYKFDSEVWKKGDNYADKIRYYNKEAQKYFAQREAINSLLMDSEQDTRSAKQIVKDAEKHFGTTNDFKETAYITTNGKQLDFSGAHEGGQKGSRSLDHRQINEIDTDMDSFISMGNIRVLPESGGINLAIEPNTKQYSMLRDYIEYAKQNGDEIYVDVDTENGTYDSARYNKNTPTSTIINDIKQYFATGQFPQKSEYADFYYSLSKNNQNQQTGFEGTQTIKDYTDYIDSLNTYNLPTNVDIEDEESYGVLTEEDYKNKKRELIDKYVDRAASKIEEQVKEVARRNLALKNKDIADLRNIIGAYYEMSREDIYSSDAKDVLRQFVEDHSHQEYEEQLINDEIRDMQKDIRAREFIISSDYKEEFPDGLTKFKKNNPGINIKFGAKGNLDTQLQELADLYPGQIDANVTYGDIPYVLADLMKKEYKQTKMQEFNLTEKEIDNITNKMFYGLTNNAISDQDLDRYVTDIQDKIRNKYARQMAIKNYRQEAKEMLDEIGLSNIKDKKRGLLYQVNTMKRNLRDIMNKESADKMYNTYFKPISIHNAQIENDLNNYYDRINKYHINNEESTYAQMLGELKYNPVTTLTEQFVNDYLTKNKNKIDVSKVESAIEETRAVYDELMPRINEALIANGYKPIEYRQGYFPHFIEDKAGSVIGKFAEKLGFKVDKGQLPTDIAGITEEFVPGKAWTSFSQQRTGDATDYNLLKGLDNYLRGAMDIIYHTQDIQKLRALEAQMRYEYTDKGVREKIDEIFNNQELSNEEKYAQAALVTDNQKNNPLGNLVTELRNYTNSLANKKSISDRGMEQTMGRDMYSVMNNISSRVSANMVGANISSAMTNFIPITQAWSQVKTKNMLKAIYATIKSNIRDDGFSDKSIYLTNRTKQADRLFKTKLDKATQKLGIPFEAIDSFTSNVIVRAKYYENLENGMNDVEAMDNADEFAKDVMAGRSKGDSPTMFNKKNPITKLFTAFQLEVNNQYGYMFKDIKADIGKEAKDKIAMAFLKMFLGAFIYNQITEKITGRKAAFSPIDMAIDEAKIITNDNMDLATKLQNIAKDVAEEAPFLGGVLGGGRLPIQGAIPYGDPLSMITSTWENIGALMDDEKRDKAINSLKKEWLKPVYYVALPVAGGQIKKTNEGFAMYNHELPGSYTDSGKLRFEADTSPLGKLQAAVFGQYASGNAREYFAEGYTPLSEKQVEEAMEANLPITEYREVKKGLTKATKVAKKEGTSQAEAKVDYIYNLPLNDDQKNVLVNNALNRKEDIDISNYGDYSSLEEFDYANKNPQKYDTIRQVANYNVYNVYKDNIQKIKQEHAYTSTRRKAVEDYINSLPLNYYQKLILQKEAAGYSIEKYEVELYNYINGLDISAKEKKNIHKELFG